MFRLCAYLRIGTDAYPPEFHESSAAFLAKLRLFPSGCKIVDAAGESVAFLISHPWTYENPPKLNSEAFTVPASPDVFFIHSVTVMRAYQKHGFGSARAEAAISSRLPKARLRGGILCPQLVGVSAPSTWNGPFKGCARLTVNRTLNA
jgi:hypothetical protein